MRLLLVACLLSGCLTSEVEPQVTITQGLYGQLTERCEGADCLGRPRVGAHVAWFATSPFTDLPDGGSPEPLQALRSKTNGFYEFNLEAATKGYLAVGVDRPGRIYWFAATATSVPRGLGRIDWQAGPGEEGTWNDVQ